MSYTSEICCFPGGYDEVLSGYQPGQMVCSPLNHLTRLIARENFIMLYTTLKGRWCDIIVLNVHAPTGDKGDVVKDSFCEELEQVLISSLGTV
jgi:hypothetical protein